VSNTMKARCARQASRILFIPLEVAEVLAEMKMDATSIAAGLLHDSVEDTPATNDEIAEEFATRFAHIVEGVTKIGQNPVANREDRQAENVARCCWPWFRCARVLIKLADRLHNMRTLQHLQPDRQEAIARESKTSMLLWRTGWGWAKVRGELEDLAFRYTDPVDMRRSRWPWKRDVSRASSFLRNAGRDAGGAVARKRCRGSREWRIKRLYSIYQKIGRSKVRSDQVMMTWRYASLRSYVAACYAFWANPYTWVSACLGASRNL